MSRALCAGAALVGADLWFSDVEAEREEAKRICDRCAQAPGCLRGALERGEQHGVWGSLDLSAVELAEPVAWEMPAIPAPEHNRAHYVGGCRAPECLAANTRYVAHWREVHRFAAVEVREPLPEQLDLFAGALSQLPIGSDA